ncbi:MAG: trypsin-like serine protease [Deltaproteobacteria bacterium]
MRLSVSSSGLLALCIACGATDEPGDELGVIRQAVIGGTVVPAGRWDEVSSHDCTGVLIAKRWVLMREATTVVVDADCSGTNWSCQVPGKELIAGHPGVDTCSGDSGGPAYVLSSIGPLVAGITSRGANPETKFSSGGDAPCGTVPGLYVRPDGAIDWIQSIIGEQLPEPACVDEPDSGGGEGGLGGTSARRSRSCARGGRVK